MDSVGHFARPKHSWRAPTRLAPPLSPRALAGESLTLEEFAYTIATGVGATRDPRTGCWHFDRRHLTAGGRLPMQFYARVTPPPPPLGGMEPTASAAVYADTINCPQLRGYAAAGYAHVALVFIEQAEGEPVLPSEALTAPLYWRLVSTDSCEALHLGVLLALRTLISEQHTQVRRLFGSKVACAPWWQLCSSGTRTRMAAVQVWRPCNMADVPNGRRTRTR